MVFTLQLIYTATITAFAFTLIAHIANCIHASYQSVRQKRDEIDAIPFMKKRELIAIARANGIKYNKLSKYALQNTLIYKLA